VDKLAGPKLKRGNLIFRVGVGAAHALWPTCEGVDIIVEFGTALLSAIIGGLGWDTGAGGTAFAGSAGTTAIAGSPFTARVVDLC
jgi:hypothetical protein